MKWTNKQLLDIIRKFEKKNGRVPRCSDCNRYNHLPNYATFKKRFGSFNRAIIKAGFYPRLNSNDRAWTRDNLIKGLQSYAKKIGRAPTYGELRDAGLPYGLRSWLRHFPSFNDAVIVAGLTPHKSGGQRSYSDKELVDSLRKIYSTVRRVPTNSDFLRAKKPNLRQLLTYRFGDLQSACRAAGIKITLKERLRMLIGRIANVLLRWTEGLS